MPANLKAVLDPENVSIVRRVKDWQSAAALAIRPLEEEGTVDGGFCKKIIENTYLYGPYYVLTKEAALLHAQYAGIKRTRLAVTVLRESVAFTEKKPGVRILIVLAADSSNRHIDYLVSIVKILKDRERIKKIMDAESPREVYRLFVED